MSWMLLWITVAACVLSIWSMFKPAGQSRPATVPSPPQPRRSLEGRIVMCLDCETSVVLAASPVGTLHCSACGGSSWMFLYKPLPGIKPNPLAEVQELERLYGSKAAELRAGTNPEDFPVPISQAELDAIRHSLFRDRQQRRDYYAEITRRALKRVQRPRPNV